MHFGVSLGHFTGTYGVYVFVSTLLQKVYFLKYIFEFFRVEKRVDRMEKSIGSIVTKIDAVLAKEGIFHRENGKKKHERSNFNPNFKRI